MRWGSDTTMTSIFRFDLKEPCKKITFVFSNMSHSLGQTPNNLLRKHYLIVIPMCNCMPAFFGIVLNQCVLFRMTRIYLKASIPHVSHFSFLFSKKILMMVVMGLGSKSSRVWIGYHFPSSGRVFEFSGWWVWVPKKSGLHPGFWVLGFPNPSLNDGVVVDQQHHSLVVHQIIKSIFLNWCLDLS